MPETPTQAFENFSSSIGAIKMHALLPQHLELISGGYCRSYDYDYDYDDDYDGNDYGPMALGIGLFELIDSSIEDPWTRTALKVSAGAVIVGLIVTAGVIALNQDDDC